MCFLNKKQSFNTRFPFLFLECQDFLRTENIVYRKMQSDLDFKFYTSEFTKQSILLK